MLPGNTITEHCKHYAAPSSGTKSSRDGTWIVVRRCKTQHTKRRALTDI